MKHHKEGGQRLDEEKDVERKWMQDSPLIIRRHLRSLLLGFAAWMVLASIYIYSRQPPSSPSTPAPLEHKGVGYNHVVQSTPEPQLNLEEELDSPLSDETSSIFESSIITPSATAAIVEALPSHAPKQTDAVYLNATSPFTGEFSRFPRISALPERQRRLTILGVWNNDAVPAYLHHFFYSIQLNADVLDLVLINRKLTEESRCADWEKAGINIIWGGNVKVHCMDNKEWKRRHVDFLCSQEYGWNCNPTEYEDVTKEYADRKDESNYNWRPFRGYIFRDLFTHPENPFWAWMDHDLFVGNFARYPFNLLSQLSLVTGNSAVPSRLFMAGQLTAFNLDDDRLGTAWKRFPELKTASHFTKYLEGKMPETTEEQIWSYHYLRSTDDNSGTDLSYGMLPDIYGDDFYEGKWNMNNTKQTYVVSGREILLVSTSYSREDIEQLIRLERNEPVDDLGSLGWTPGDEAIIDEQPIITNRTGSAWWKQYVKLHPLVTSDPPALRATLVHFKDQKPGHIWQRLERDTRPRGYERKLVRHHLKTKKLDWYEFPPFAIKEDMVLRYNNDEIEVFKMGAKREKTIFYRKEGEESIG